MAAASGAGAKAVGRVERRVPRSKDAGGEDGEGHESVQDVVKHGPHLPVQQGRLTADYLQNQERRKKNQ